MKISAIRTGIVNLPANEPLADAAANPNGKRPIVWVRIGTDGGAEGIGVAYFGGAITKTLRHAIDELGALTVGIEAAAAKTIVAAETLLRINETRTGDGKKRRRGDDRLIHVILQIPNAFGLA